MAAGFGHFDADAFRAAQEEPTLTVGNLLYRGRLLSIEEWLVFAEEEDALRAKSANVREHLVLYRRYLEAVFPRKRYRFWAPDPVAHLMAMPYGVVLEAIGRFFVLQARASRARPAETSGTSSETSTPPAVAEMDVIG